VPGQKKVIGVAAARAYKQRRQSPATPGESPVGAPAVAQPGAAFEAAPSSSDRNVGIALGLSLFVSRLWGRMRRVRHEQR